MQASYVQALVSRKKSLGRRMRKDLEDRFLIHHEGGYDRFLGLNVMRR